VDKQDLQRISAEVEKENLLFADKTFLDNLTLPSQIIGREMKAKELVRFLLGYKRGLVVPFVSVYGRSGSGKSTVVKFVCQNLDENISCAFVNLRKARTVFGCANLILTELGQPSLKSAEGINIAIDKISKAIEQRLSSKGGDNGKFFILVLDEFDVLLYDKRGRPSDFIYKLLTMEEKLRENGLLMCIIAISNNVMSDYEIDDRVRSRIGTSEVFFEPYSQEAVLRILEDRSAKVFFEPIESEILRYCAERSSKEHGDARRAIDLLRVAAEIAGRRKTKITKLDINSAVGKLQKDRVSTTLLSASYHLKLAALALARISYLLEESWHFTSTLYNQYRHIQSQDDKPLTYRRFSELLIELENMGLLTSHTGSRGRQGYGTQYKLLVPPEVIARVCAQPQWWTNIVHMKAQHGKNESGMESFGQRRGTKAYRSSIGNLFDNSFKSINDKAWKDFVGPK
jgi:archaeal cell division control protein 6